MVCTASVSRHEPFKIHPPSWLSLLSHAQWFACSSYNRLALRFPILCLLMNKGNILSTRKESPFLRKSRPCLPVRAHFPHHSCDAYNDYSHDCGIRFPVRGLWVPATCWRPDVLGVSLKVVRKIEGELCAIDLRNLAAATLRNVSSHWN